MDVPQSVPEALMGGGAVRAVLIRSTLSGEVDVRQNLVTLFLLSSKFSQSGEGLENT